MAEPWRWWGGAAAEAGGRGAVSVPGFLQPGEQGVAQHREQLEVVGQCVCSHSSSQPPKCTSRRG